MLPITTLIALSLGYIVAGAILIEVVFSWPGMGRAVYDAVQERDYPMLQGAFLVLTVSVIFFNLVAGRPPLLQARSEDHRVSDATFFVEAPPEGGTTKRGLVRQTLREQRVALGAALFLAACVVMAILAPVIAPYPLHEQVGPVFGHPSWHHLLGPTTAGCHRHRRPSYPGECASRSSSASRRPSSRW